MPGNWGAREQWAAAYGQGRGSGPRSNGVCGGSAPLQSGWMMEIALTAQKTPSTLAHRSELRGADLLSLVTGNIAVTCSQTEMN